MHADGLYFGLDEEAYHADPALGYSDHKALVVNPPRWQFKRLKLLREALGLPDKETEGQSDAKDFGKAVHTMILEGPDVFDARYYVAGDPPEGLLSTKEELRAALEPCWEADEKATPLIKSAARPDYVREAKHYGLALIDDWREAEAERRGEREELSKTWAALIRLIGRMLDAPRADHGGKSLRAKALSNGFSEVSVFWSVSVIEGEPPVRLKARFDYLRPGIIVEPKTYGAQDGWEPIDAFTKKVKDFAYDIQAPHYREAYEAAQAFVSHGTVFVEDTAPFPAAEWLERLAATPLKAWDWLAIQTISLPEVDLLNFPLDGMVATSGRSQVEWARSRYAEYRRTFGDDAIWVNGRGRIILEDDQFNPSITNRGAERWKRPT